MNNRFVVIMPCYNAEKTITQSLLSLLGQSYSNWKLLIRDDMSTDNTRAIIDNFTNVFNLQERIIVETNTEKKWEVRNILEMLAWPDHTKEDDIICRLDGDDWLTDLDCFAILNKVYNEREVDVVWTGHRWGFSDNNISGPLPQDADPYKHPWVSSHFKTFRRKLISNISDKNFRGENGEYFKRIGDQAIYLPVLKQSSGRWHFEPRVMYHYTIDLNEETFKSKDAIFQRKEGEFLRSRGFV